MVADRRCAMPVRRSLMLGLGCWPLCGTSQERSATPPAELARALKSPRLLGQGRMTYFGLQIYDARLWVEPGFSAPSYQEHSFALELTYGRAFDGQSIAERSLKEMKSIEALSELQAQRWLAAMRQAFPDVKAGDRLTGVHAAGGATRFYANGVATGELTDPDFGRLFFGIWLSPRSSEPGLRKNLLGQP